MGFEFATAQRVIFGAATSRQAAMLARRVGTRALVVTGRDTARAQFLLESLRENLVRAAVFSVVGEPSIDTVLRGVALAEEELCDLVISLGGGSALDAGKAIAAMLTNPGDVLDYLEVIGAGKALTEPSAPFIALPTTAGTGSEVTRNAVLASPEHRQKISLRAPSMLPSVAIVDPELTWGVPPATTACTGMDALTQLIEPYVCVRANPMTDALCVEGMPRVARSLRIAFEDGRQAGAREDMALASLFGGMALNNAGLGAVHGFAGAIGGMIPAPHGAICAALLPHVMEANLRAMREREPRRDALRRYEEIARLLTGRLAASADDGVEWVRQLVRALRVPTLGSFGLIQADLSEVIEKGAKASSMKANPIVLTIEEQREILGRVL
ncbi:MAG TPA: iron-containing alcohol dehydrogenase [Verrucomicrobiae bacterium]|jgi:alcohol dehydrogenase class IV|nr:iron-containing alcohol dehydrogenase [Verrucomicrobiae bacterium]